MIQSSRCSKQCLESVEFLIYTGSVGISFWLFILQLLLIGIEFFCTVKSYHVNVKTLNVSASICTGFYF